MSMHWSLMQRPAGLTALIAEGLPNAEIAVRLVVSEATAQDYVCQLLAAAPR
jgi:DNA-binding NarL/FixJ family response regulator